MTRLAITSRWGTVPFEALRRFEPPAGLGPGGVAYSEVGPTGSPAVLVLGGISAHRDPSCHGRSPSGWWSFVCRPGGPIDLLERRVLSVDFLCGSGSSAGAAAPALTGAPFVSTGDQADAIAGLLDHLGGPRPIDVIGASYGGMVAMQLARRRPDLVSRLLLFSSAHRSHPMATAWRHLQRAVLTLGARHEAVEEAVSIARGIGMTTYRTPDEFESRFSPAAVWEPGGPRFEVEAYLQHHGRRAVEQLPPQTLYCLSASADAHGLAPEELSVPTVSVLVDSDRLVPPWLIREFEARHGGECNVVPIESRYGHDAFLKEEKRVSRIVEDFIREAA